MSTPSAIKENLARRARDSCVYRKMRTGIETARLYRNWPQIMLRKALRCERDPEEVVLWNNTRFRVRRNSADKGAIREINLLNSYRIEDGDIGDGAVVIDIGAHIGVFSVFAATRARNVVVYSFEPDPANYTLLLHNVESNDLTGGIHTFGVGVAGRRGTRRLKRSKTSLARHSLFVNKYLSTLAAEDAREIKCVTLADIFVENHIRKCDVLKLDCEGAEYEILLNVPSSVLSSIRKITLEYHDSVTGRSHRDLEEFLRTKGFDVDVREGPATKDIQLGTICALNGCL